MRNKGMAYCANGFGVELADISLFTLLGGCLLPGAMAVSSASGGRGRRRCDFGRKHEVKGRTPLLVSACP